MLIRILSLCTFATVFSAAGYSQSEYDSPSYELVHRNEAIVTHKIVCAGNHIVFEYKHKKYETRPMLAFSLGGYPRPDIREQFKDYFDIINVTFRCTRNLGHAELLFQTLTETKG